MQKLKIGIFLFLISFVAKPQGNLSLNVVALDSPEILKLVKYKKTFSNEIDLKKELKQIIISLQQSAYLAASIDSSKKDSLITTAYLHIGEIYKWAILKKGNVDEGILSTAGFREKVFRGKKFYYNDVSKLNEKLVSYCENNGYPFASIKLDSIEFSDKGIIAILNLQKNKRIIIDSVIIKGTAKISSTYIQNYIGIKSGDEYNESKIVTISKKLKELPFVRETKPFEVLLSEKENKIMLYLERKDASTFDGIIGFLPDNKTGKILFTGDVRLALYNSLGRGELFDLNWRRLQSETQDIKAKVNMPFLLNTPFGIDYSLKIYKKDTTFIETNQSIGIQYSLTGVDYFKVYYNPKTTNLLSTKGLESLTTLPPYADISTNIYGLGYKTQRLDYRFNPRKGYSASITGGAGNRKIKKNTKLNPIIYDSLKLSSAQYTAEFEGSIFVPLKSRSTIKFGLQSAWLYNSEQLFVNELFRFGGLKTLRGFDEESLFASSYAIATLEYRFILEENSFINLFFDGAYYENRALNNFIHDTPFGFGAGISFQTKAGIFSLNYALGSQNGNPIFLRSGKIHFGIVNYF